MFKSFYKNIQSYKYRSVPWLLWNWKKRPIKQISLVENSQLSKQEDVYLKTLKSFFSKLSIVDAQNESVHDLMLQELGFFIERRQSNIKDGGRGVFVTDGVIHEGEMVALYPGTVYYPMEPVFFQSLFNPFILKCVDGVLIDGNNRGISKIIFRSCKTRDQIGSYSLCDTTWLTNTLVNPLSVGQYVNNETLKYPANVVYQELDIPASFGVSNMKYIPNINYNTPVFLQQEDIDIDSVILIRTVILRALRDISKDEELFSTYHTEVQMRLEE